MNRTMGAKEWSLLILLSLLWGGSFFFAEVALDEVGPFTVVLARVGLAALALLAVLRLTGQAMPWAPRLWLAFLAMGLLNNAIPFSLIFWGQVHIASGLAAILNATTPLFTVLLAHVLTRDETITANRLAGVLLGLAGVAVLIGPQALEGLGTAAWAQLAVLGAALSYGCAAIFGRRFRGQPPLVTATGQVTASTLLILPLAAWLEQPWLASPGPVTWASLVALALFSTALAYVVYFRILATAGSTNLMLVTLLIPPSALLLGVLILGERFGASEAGGLLLISLGLVAVDGRLFGWITTRPAPGP